MRKQIPTSAVALAFPASAAFAWSAPLEVGFYAAPEIARKYLKVH